MQDHAKQKYIVGHLSLIRSLALDIPGKVATMRDVSLKKRDSDTFLRHLSFWVSRRLFFFIQKNKKKY